jgi:threonine/homoserine/homoserine lactone efflux protein
MTLTEWTILALVCLAGASSPGPSLALLLQTIMKDGRRAGVVFGLAHGLGIFFYAVLVVSGVSVALSFVPLLIDFVEICGLFFLVWLAFLMFKSSFGTKKFDTQEDIKNSNSIIWHARSGFLVVFLNPKVAAFFLAIFTQFLESSPTFETKFIMVLTATVIDAGWYVLMSFIMAMPLFMKFLVSNSQRLEFVLGSILSIVSILLGFKILTNLLG